LTDKIKLHAETATKYADYVKDHDPRIDWHETRDKKFAELIVRDCANVISDRRFDNTRPSMNIAQAMILQQFNIEQ